MTDLTKDERETEIAEAVERLIDVAISRHYNAASDETFIECHFCGDWDGHADGCQVPILEQWLWLKGKA